MDFDPVLLARVPVRLHHCFPHHFPELHDRAGGLYRDAGAMWLRTGNDRYHHLMRFWTKIFAVSFAHGRRVRHRALLPVRHQLEPLLGRRRQRGRSADRLRGAERIFPGGDFPRRAAVRLQPRAALALCALRCDRRDRHRDLGLLDLVGQQLDANAERSSR